jgi:hypothetical protein
MRKSKTLIKKPARSAKLRIDSEIVRVLGAIDLKEIQGGANTRCDMGTCVTTAVGD